jgi:hypothetical protein
MVNNTVRLMAWVTSPDHKQTYHAEIYSADGNTRTAYVLPPDDLCTHAVPFSALQSVALYEGNRVLQAFGRPPAASVPAWVQYQEVEA